MAIRPIILEGPGRPKRRFPTSLQVGPSSAAIAASEYIWGTHAAAINAAEQVKSAIWRSTRAAVVTTLGAFVAAAPQAYADQPGPIFPSVTAGQRPPIIPIIRGAPQLADLTLQASLQDPLCGPQGPTVRQFIGGPLQVDLTLQAQLDAPPLQLQGRVPAPTSAPPPQIEDGQARIVWRALVAPPIVPNPIATFFSVPGQLEERPTRSIWASQVRGSTPPVISSIYGASQLLDLTQQATVIKPSLSPVVVSYAFRSIYGAPQLIDLTQQAWIAGKLPAKHGRVPPSIFASQADPSQRAAIAFPRAYPSAIPGVFGFGARSAIGTRSAVDSSKQIGTGTASKAGGGIGTESAADPNKGIGSSKA